MTNILLRGVFLFGPDEVDCALATTRSAFAARPPAAARRRRRRLFASARASCLHWWIGRMAAEGCGCATRADLFSSGGTFGQNPAAWEAYCRCANAHSVSLKALLICDVMRGR